MRKISITKAVASIAFLGLALSARKANAALTLVLSEPGYAPYSTTDTGNIGSVSFVGQYGDFQTNFVVGLTNQISGSGATADLQVQSLNVKSLASSGTQDTLTVTLTDNGFTFPLVTGSTLQLGSSIGGTITQPIVGDGVTFQSFVTSTGTTTGLQPYVVPPSAGGLSTTSFNSVATPVNFVRGATYDLENITTLSLTGGAETSNISASTTVTGNSSTVPEPASVALGLMAAAITGIRRPRRLGIVAR